MKTDLTIIINNYNYAEYLHDCIRSALDYSNAREIIVVDDGSTDSSREVIELFGSSIITVLKENGGQASAFNAGIQKANSRWVHFLDADDFLLHTYPGHIPSTIHDGVIKAHFRLRNCGHPKGTTPKKKYKLANGSETWRSTLSGTHVCPPTSGNIFSREFLKTVMPIPEIEYRICADAFLNIHAAFNGYIQSIDHVLGGYRLHGKSNYTNKKTFLDECQIIRLEHQLNLIQRLAKTKNIHNTSPYSILRPGLLVKLYKASRSGQLSSNSSLYMPNQEVIARAIRANKNIYILNRMRSLYQLLNP